MGKSESFHHVGKPNTHMQKNEVGPLPYTVHKNQLKIDLRPKRKT